MCDKAYANITTLEKLIMMYNQASSNEVGKIMSKAVNFAIYFVLANGLDEVII